MRFTITMPDATVRDIDKDAKDRNIASRSKWLEAAAQAFLEGIHTEDHQPAPAQDPELLNQVTILSTELDVQARLIDQLRAENNHLWAEIHKLPALPPPRRSFIDWLKRK